MKKGRQEIEPEATESSAKNPGISRRKFLGTVAGTGAALTVTGLLSGCNTIQPTTSAPDVQVTSTPSGVERPFSVHEADVLIIGGGIAGMFAAQKAIADGASVMIVDKGPFGHSGASGINWGHGMGTTEGAEDGGASYVPISLFTNDGMPNQDWELAVSQGSCEAGAVVKMVQAGCITGRTAGGDPACWFGAPSGGTTRGYPRILAQYVRRMGSHIFDRTMITDMLLSDQGEAAGAVGINLVTGEAHVFRAKATVMATGSYAWCHGWAGNGAKTISGPECTGDGQSMLLRMGVAMRDMEQLPFDHSQIYPKGIAFGMGGFGCEHSNHMFAFNKNGERYTQVLDDTSAGGNAVFMRLSMKELNEGRLTDNDCILLDTTQYQSMQPYYTHGYNRLKRLGYQFPDMIELHYELWESAAAPADINTTSEGPVKNLFHAFVGGEAYAGNAFFASSGSGHLAGKNAALRASEIERPNVVWNQVQDALNQAYGALESQPENGIRSLVVYHNIQLAMQEGLAPLRDEKSIQGCIDELNRIKTEEFPRMSVPSKSRQFNLGWRNALEVPNMWNCVMGTAQAALIRKETRGSHCRKDYPKVDNENWLVNTIVTLKDGTWSAATRPIVATIIPAEEVAKMVPAIGFE